MKINKMIGSLKKCLIENKYEVVLILCLLLITGIAHGINMFNFPYLENDEATYISQAASFINHGKLAPYTYYYDHVPGGWMFMGLWLLFTLKTGLIPSYLVAGRIFMLIIHISSAYVLYLISKRFTKSKAASSLVVLIYSLSPLVIYFQRRILLDNILVFWLLITVYLILHAKNRMSFYLASALTFALALLTKESALPFIIPLLYYLYTTAHTKNKKHVITQWLGVFTVTVSIYLLYAFLKGELFPSNSLLGGHSQHVSLLKTLQEQSSRGIFHYPWDKAGDFYLNCKDWIARDPYIIIAGSIALVTSMAISIKNKIFRFPTLLSLCTVLFLARGKLVINFYIVPLLPFLALNIGMVYGEVVKASKNTLIATLSLLFLLSPLAYVSFSKSNGLYSRNEVNNQVLAEDWIAENVPKSAHIAIDNYAYPYLQDTKGYKNADYMFKLQYDSVIAKKISYDWKNIDYILVTHEMIKQISIGSLPLIKEALDHSDLVADYTSGTTSYIDLHKYISTNGDWAKVYKVKSDEGIILQDSWAKYKSTYIKSYGQVVDIEHDTTTSEGQAYAMLRALSMNDKLTFDGVYSWTKDHMQHRATDKLFSWKWQKINNIWKLTDSNTATDADEDIAYALMLASNKWHQDSYSNDAKVIVDDIWTNETDSINGKNYLKPSAQKTEGNLVINPSYIAPSYYKQFSKINSRPWDKLVDDSYDFLNRVKNSETSLIPDWVEINPNGDIVNLTLKTYSPDYGYDAFRTGYRILKDEKDLRSIAYIQQLSSFYENEWDKNKTIYAVYELSGKPKVTYGDIATYAVAVDVLNKAGHKDTARAIYNEKVLKTFKNGAWGNANNYYNQNWAWFVTDEL